MEKEFNLPHTALVHLLEQRAVWSSMARQIDLRESLNISASQMPSARAREYPVSEGTDKPEDRWAQLENVLITEHQVAINFVYKLSLPVSILSPSDAHSIVSNMGKTIRSAFRELQNLKGKYSNSQSTPEQHADVADFGDTDSASSAERESEPALPSAFRQNVTFERNELAQCSEKLLNLVLNTVQGQSAVTSSRGLKSDFVMTQQLFNEVFGSASMDAQGIANVFRADSLSSKGVGDLVTETLQIAALNNTTFTGASLLDVLKMCSFILCSVNVGVAATNNFAFAPNNPILVVENLSAVTKGFVEIVESSTTVDISEDEKEALKRLFVEVLNDTSDNSMDEAHFRRRYTLGALSPAQQTAYDVFSKPSFWVSILVFGDVVSDETIGWPERSVQHCGLIVIRRAPVDLTFLISNCII